MAINNRLQFPVHIPVAQQITSNAPVSSAANMFVVNDPTGRSPIMMYVTSGTVVHLYRPDGWNQIPSPALATFGAGACGVFFPWSFTYTANGGSTTTATVLASTHNIMGVAVGETIEFLASGTNNGLRRVITGVINNAGTGTITIQWSAPVATAVLNTHTFRISTGQIYVFGGGTTAAGTFKSYDIATRAWSGNLTVTGVPTLTADSKMVCAYQIPKVYYSGQVSSVTNTTNATISDASAKWMINQWAGYWVRIFAGTRSPNNSTGAVEALYQITSNTATVLTLSGVFSSPPDNTSFYSIEDVLASGVATGGSTTTLVNSGKNWTTNQWTNYRVRITGGTGLGQSALITSNTATTLTFGTLGVAPAAGSIYEIEGDENSLYLLGNAAVTMYKYSRSANSWATVSPTTARGGATAGGMSANVVLATGDSNWSNESAILNSRYIYSFRGGAASTLDQFDIAGGTAGAGAWTAVNYVSSETFTTGASYALIGRNLIIEKESASAARRLFVYDVVSNTFKGYFTFLFPSGATVTGNKIWIKGFDSDLPYNMAGGAQPYAYCDNVLYLYSLISSGTIIHRVPFYL